MDEKKPLNPAEIEFPDAEDEHEGIVYDIDVDPEDESAAAGEAMDAVAEDDSASSAAGRRVSRQEILDRFQQKNEVISRLTREKKSLEKENEELAGQAKENRDRWLRSAAEFENYRKRSAREWELLKQQSKSEVILEVLNSLDDFERAFAVVKGGEESEFVQGIRLIYNNLLSGLQKLGVAEVEAHHRPFDPNVHMAIGQIETSEVPSGQVVEVVQKGYSLDGVLIRPARVIVAS